MAYQQLIFLLLQAMIACRTVLGTCPSSGNQALRQILACTRKLNEITDFTKAPVSASTIRNYCQTSATKEIQCVDRLMDDCRRTSPTARRVLNKALNVNGIRNSVKIICDNRQFLVSAQSCISRYQDQVSQCILDHYWSYSDKVSNLRYQGYSVTRLEEEAYKLLCQYTIQVKDCERPYRLNCGAEVGKVFDAMIDATRPPVCLSTERSVSVTPGLFSTTSPYFKKFQSNVSPSVGFESMAAVDSYHL